MTLKPKNREDREPEPFAELRRSMARQRAAGVCRAVCPAVAEELALWAD